MYGPESRTPDERAELPADQAQSSFVGALDYLEPSELADAIRYLSVDLHEKLIRALADGGATRRLRMTKSPDLPPPF